MEHSNNNFTNILKKLTLSTTIIALCASCAATSEAPNKQNFRRTNQLKLNAAAHWNVIASDMAKQLALFIIDRDIQDKPIYINLYSQPSTFTVNFNELLTRHLIKSGVHVSKSMANSTIYNYKVETIKYNSYRTSERDQKFKWTTLASGILVARSVMHVLDIPRGGLLTSVASYDILKDDLAPKSELLISSSILSNNVYLYKTADIYYTNTFDKHLYESRKNRNNVFDEPFYTE